MSRKVLWQNRIKSVTKTVKIRLILTDRRAKGLSRQNSNQTWQNRRKNPKIDLCQEKMAIMRRRKVVIVLQKCVRRLKFHKLLSFKNWSNRIYFYLFIHNKTSKKWAVTKKNRFCRDRIITKQNVIRTGLIQSITKTEKCQIFFGVTKIFLRVSKDITILSRLSRIK